MGLDHVMDFTRLRALGTLFSLLNQAVRNVLAYNNGHADFPMQVRVYVCARVVHGPASVHITNVCVLHEIVFKRITHRDMLKKRL